MIQSWPSRAGIGCRPNDGQSYALMWPFVKGSPWRPNPGPVSLKSFNEVSPAGWRRGLGPTAPRFRTGEAGCGFVGESPGGPPVGPFFGSTVKVLPYATRFTVPRRIAGWRRFTLSASLRFPEGSRHLPCFNSGRFDTQRRNRFARPQASKTRCLRQPATPASGKRELCRQASEARRCPPGRPP